jgi:DnaK suppressor protein
MTMTSKLKAVRRMLELRLKGSLPTRDLRESIYIPHVADPLDITQQAADREVAVQNLDRESALARQLRSAIQRVDDGSYGVCLQCEEEIGPNRLKAIPWAELCIRCQEQADRMGATRVSLRMPESLKEAA